MRQVAGTLRLDLAQYRELAAFAQFGSELDKATQSQLSRGQRLVELLKQPQYEPLAVEQQIMIIFAGTTGLLDDIAVTDVQKFEREFYRFVETRHGAVCAAIREKQQLDEQLKTDLAAAIKEFAVDFAANRKTEAA